MRRGQRAVGTLVWLLIAGAAGAGCGSKPPYRISEPPPPTAEQLQSLGRIELAGSPAGVRGRAPTPRVWIGIPDRRVEGAAIGAGVGAIVGGLAGAAIYESGKPAWPAPDPQTATIVGTFIGTTIGGAVIGAFLGQPGPEARAAAAELRRHAAAVDVASRAREGVLRSARLQAYREAGPAAGPGPGGRLTVEVVAYGTRSAGWNQACPFVAVRTRLADASTGRVIYDCTSDVWGQERNFHQWSYGDGADFRRELESLALDLGRLSADRALTPRGR